MNVKIEASWKNVLDDEFKKPYFKQIVAHLKTEKAQGKAIYPPGSLIFNAFEKTHGPSWRMIVELTDDINAYGVYPGGQSGNPGSKYYDDFIDTWAAGKYYRIHFYKKGEASQKNALGKIVFSKS